MGFYFAGLFNHFLIIEINFIYFFNVFFSVCACYQFKVFVPFQTIATVLGLNIYLDAFPKKTFAGKLQSF